MRLRVAAVLERALEGPVASFLVVHWVLPPPLIAIWLYIALSRAPSMDCYGGAVPKLYMS